MEVNTLVRHKKLKTLGIGCVAKITGKKVKVNFGTDDVMTCDPKMLVKIDTSECKTISFHEWRGKSMCNSFDKDDPCYYIIGNELKHYVGIGWTTQRIITEGDLKKYKRVV